jgi:hypothetical protein
MGCKRQVNDLNAKIDKIKLLDNDALSAVMPFLNERSRRAYASAFSSILGYGGALAKELQSQGFKISPYSVGKMLNAMGCTPLKADEPNKPEKLADLGHS